MVMIKTKKPYGAVNIREVLFLGENPRNNKKFVVDKNANQWEIDITIFNELVNSGFEVKEVRFR